MDVLYRVRQGKVNEQLRYSLRSLANIPHGNVYMVGSPPPWVGNVDVIEGRPSTKWRALVEDLHTACVELDGRTLLLMDDDMFVLRPVATIPALHAGRLRVHAETKVGAYQRSMLATADYLNSKGVDDPRSYELHVPMVIDATAMAAVLGPVVKAIRALQARSLYGNLVGVGGTRADDVKMRRGDDLLTGDFASGSPAWWHAQRDRIAALLPDASPYE